jgi:putative membrane protein
MARRLPIAAFALLVLAACGRPAPDTDTKALAARQAAETKTFATAAVAPPSPVASAADFVAKAAASDLFEVMAGQTAQARATSNPVKDFAAMMVRDHTKSSQDLKKAIAEAGRSLPAPAGLAADQQAKLTELSTGPSTAFDKAYMRSQLDAHQTALAVLQRYAQDGDVPSLKAFAGQALGVVQHHLQEARQLHAQLE